MQESCHFFLPAQFYVGTAYYGDLYKIVYSCRIIIVIPSA